MQGVTSTTLETLLQGHLSVNAKEVIAIHCRWCGFKAPLHAVANLGLRRIDVCCHKCERPLFAVQMQHALAFHHDV